MKNTIWILSLITAFQFFISGCATELPLRGSYYKFYDSHDDYVVTEKNGDLYIEKLDLTDSRRVTFNPSEPKTEVTFSKNGRCIVYSVNRCCVEPKIVYYIQSVDKDDSARTQITPEEFFAVRRK